MRKRTPLDSKDGNLVRDPSPDLQAKILAMQGYALQSVRGARKIAELAFNEGYRFPDALDLSIREVERWLDRIQLLLDKKFLSETDADNPAGR